MFRGGTDERSRMVADRSGRGNPVRFETRIPWPVRDENHSGQVTKGVWGMSWRQKAMKGVEGCDKPGEAVKQALIPGSPNVVR
jgi:hypothetical protein